jgi:hypothetical protein
LEKLEKELSEIKSHSTATKQDVAVKTPTTDQPMPDASDQSKNNNSAGVWM